jgi:hypothetical protein
LELTAESPVSDAHFTIIQDLEMRLADRYGEVEDNRGIHPRQLFTLSTETSLHDPFMKLRVAATKTTKRPGNWNAELMARNWGIGREAAERTLRATTRRGVREYDGNEVRVERRFPTGDRHLRYTRLNHSVYHDTLFSSIKSTIGNKCSQVYATDFCWSRNFPIMSKSDAHHTLDEFFHRYGVPTNLTSDNARELTQGEFARKVRQAQCPIDLTDTYSPWQHLAES